jgi:hypothetical protein
MNTLRKCALREQKQFQSEGDKIILDNQIHEQVRYFDYSACSKYYERYNDISKSTHYSGTRKGTLQTKYENCKTFAKLLYRSSQNQRF